MTEETKKTKGDGFFGILSLILGAGGVLFSYLIIFFFLEDILEAESAGIAECGATAPFFIPAFAFLGIAAGIMWLVASVGFFQKKEWAYSIAIIGTITALFASLWPNIPAMESGAAPPVWFLIFIPNLVAYFILVRSKGQEPRSKAWLGLGVGMAFILNFINGIASSTRMINRLPSFNPLIENFKSAEMYMLTLPGNMIASLLFGIAAVGLFLAKKKEWVRIVGLAGALLSICAGFPLAFYSMFSGDVAFSFSMFILGPIVSTVVGIFFLSPKLWKKTMKLAE